MARRSAAHPTLGRNIEALIRHRGLKAKQLSQRSRVAQSTLSRVLAGDGDTNMTTVAAIADSLDCDIDPLLWPAEQFDGALSLITPQEPLRAENVRLSTALREPRVQDWTYSARPIQAERVKVVGEFRVLGRDGGFDEIALLDAGGTVPGIGHSGLQAVRVRGDALSPVYKDGMYLYLRVTGKPVPERPVVLVLRDGRRLIRELTFEREASVVVSSVVDPSDRMTLNHNEIEAMYPIVGTVFADEWQPPQSS